MKEIIRLRASGLSHRQIARSLNLSKDTVGKYLKRAHETELELSALQGLEGNTLKTVLT
jgi:DNA-binding CsgD family transcriptional regulator